MITVKRFEQYRGLETWHYIKLYNLPTPLVYVHCI